MSAILYVCDSNFSIEEANGYGDTEKTIPIKELDDTYAVIYKESSGAESCYENGTESSRREKIEDFIVVAPLSEETRVLMKAKKPATMFAVDGFIVASDSLAKKASYRDIDGTFYDTCCKSEPVAVKSSILDMLTGQDPLLNQMASNKPAKQPEDPASKPVEQAKKPNPKQLPQPGKSTKKKDTDDAPPGFTCDIDSPPGFASTNPPEPLKDPNEPLKDPKELPKELPKDPKGGRVNPLALQVVTKPPTTVPNDEPLKAAQPKKVPQKNSPPSPPQQLQQIQQQQQPQQQKDLSPQQQKPQKKTKPSPPQQPKKVSQNKTLATYTEDIGINDNSVIFFNLPAKANLASQMKGLEAAGGKLQNIYFLFTVDNTYTGITIANYSNYEEASAAIDNIHGKWVNDRTVVAMFYDSLKTGVFKDTTRYNHYTYKLNN